MKHFSFQFRLRKRTIRALSKALVLVSFLWSPVRAQSIKTYANWYFGDGAGVTFTSGSALTDGKLHTAEGCASMSDENGQLLFYTDGSTIWNRNHDVMPGATGLGGNSHATQSALIVPYQNSTKQFYVFSVGTQNQNSGIQYAYVDMNLNGGLGGLTYKNKVLLAGSSEKITVIKHCNNLNHWVITHDFGNNTFRVYLINDNGLILTPSLYSVGSTHQSLSGAGHSARQQNKGYMKPSHDGRKLAVAVSDSIQGGFLEVFNFDNKTGVISNPVKLETVETMGAYGVEFSPDNSLLYLSSMFSKNIQQINVASLSVNATLTVQGQTTYSPGIGALQIGLDGKIYGAVPGEAYLLAINQPNQSGTGCGLVSQGVSLSGRKAMAGLPFLLDEVVLLPPELSISLKKPGGCNNFLLESKVVNLDPNYLLYQWYVDGVAAAGGDKATLKPTKTGTYTLKIRETKCQDIQITSNEIKVVLVEANPTAKAVPDSCGAFLLNAHASGGAVQWTGFGISPPRDQLDSLIVSKITGSQTFRVRVVDPDDGTCFSEKELTVTFSPPPPFPFANPIRSGCGDTLMLRATPTADWDTFRWKQPDGASVTGTTVLARQSGYYQLTALSTSTGCKSEDSITVNLFPNPKLQLSQHQVDTCFANSSSYLELNAGSIPNVIYTWTSDGKTIGTTQFLKAYAYGSYTISVHTSDGCQAADSVRIRTNCPPSPAVINVPDAFTPNQDGMNEVLVIYGSGAKQMSLTVYNRWGEPIYRANNGVTSPSGWETWDGTYQGQPVASGVYAYKLEGKSVDYPDSFTREGVIEVIR
ncbi:T9SS type B sorting domain-containing protein [Spirosoma foliorum]|uniref:T9SS type B sorting domain-containing protein n=1 Tax=Spirosoma foliorum TaxID=2710596 RepID=UPI001F0A2CF3|nr:gliding motility-associated C-terminal domain-containing protein [Spirosoma foliorum]